MSGPTVKWAIAPWPPIRRSSTHRPHPHSVAAAVLAQEPEPEHLPVLLLVDDADEQEHGPLRRCIVTRTRQEKDTMLRFVVSPDGAIVPDLAARLPGRGS